MRNRLDDRLNSLNGSLIEMGDLVSESIDKALIALVRKDIGLANEVIEEDRLVNQMEYDIEQESIKLILRHQPVASDLRLTTSILKIITDLERIGDQAADISLLIIKMNKRDYSKSDLGSIIAMGERTQLMLKTAMKAYKDGDVSLAEDVIAMDEIVDECFSQIRSEVIKDIKNDHFSTKNSLDILMIGKYMERIGDHAQNIGEWVYYSIMGSKYKL